MTQKEGLRRGHDRDLIGLGLGMEGSEGLLSDEVNIEAESLRVKSDHGKGKGRVPGTGTAGTWS